MNDDRLYSALLTLYPRPFRRAYGDAMLEAFRELRASDRRSAVRFWLFVGADACRSAWREQLDACRSGMRRFLLQWVGVCTLGVGVTAIVANLLNWAFSYLYHPYLEGVSFSPWTYGALLGCGLGIVQATALGQRVHVGAAWILVSALSAAIGLELAVVVSDLTGAQAFGVVLGACVGSGQWIVLRTQTRCAALWIGVSAMALPIGVISFGGGMHRTLAGMNPIANPMGAQGEPSQQIGPLIHALYAPRSWAELLVELALVAMAGMVVGALTARAVAANRMGQSRWSNGLQE